jgi:hypothetical protein
MNEVPNKEDYLVIKLIGLIIRWHDKPFPVGLSLDGQIEEYFKLVKKVKKIISEFNQGELK